MNSGAAKRSSSVPVSVFFFFKTFAIRYKSFLKNLTKNSFILYDFIDNLNVKLMQVSNENETEI